MPGCPQCLASCIVLGSTQAWGITPIFRSSQSVPPGTLLHLGALPLQPLFISVGQLYFYLLSLSLFSYYLLIFISVINPSSFVYPKVQDIFIYHLHSHMHWVKIIKSAQRVADLSLFIHIPQSSPYVMHKTHWLCPRYKKDRQFVHNKVVVIYLSLMLN